jgi:hypothetical protein
MLWLESGAIFAVGKADYSLSPPEDPKLNVGVEVDGIHTLVVLDTAAPFLLCSLWLATQLDVSKFDRIGSTRIVTNRGTLSGDLYRLPLRLIASEGNAIEIQATAIVPDLNQDHWRDAPTFLGFRDCLDRLRFAIDPSEEKFYFGPYP